MFCGNCGKQIQENAQFCGNCGARIGVASPLPVYNQTVNTPSSYNETQESVEEANYPPGYTPKKWITALVLIIFLGTFGAHRF